MSKQMECIIMCNEPYLSMALVLFGISNRDGQGLYSPSPTKNV